MPVYRERLGVPAWWWLAALVIVGLAGTLLWAGLGLIAAIAVYAATGALTAAMLLGWGRAVIEVTAGELRAGRARLPLEEAGQVAALDRAQTGALRGPRADPAAFLLIRPYLPEAVYVQVAGPVTGQPPAWPYWLLGTRNPGALAAAIERLRPPAAPGRPCDDGTTDRAAGVRARPASRQEDSNAG